MEDDWDLIQKLFKVYPELFDLSICNYDLYLRCSSFIATRCFGWGLPTTIVAPIADSFNHSPIANNSIDMINKRHHLIKNKIYGYHYNFDRSSKNETDDDTYDKTQSKFEFSIQRLYKDDQISEEQSILVAGEERKQIDKPYDDKEVF